MSSLRLLRRPGLVLLELGLVLTSQLTGFAVNTSLTEILADPDRFNGQMVTIQGMVTNLRERVSRRGTAYYTFDLSDGKQAVRVFSFGKSPCRSGAATVEGTFEKAKRQGRYVFDNEVSATSVKCR